MRKFLCLAACAGIVLGAMGIAACGREEGLARYDIRGEYFPAENKLVAEMDVSVPNLTEGTLESLSFELWANAYREGAKYTPVSDLYRSSAYYAGESYGGIEISSVEGAESFQVCGEDENILSVTLKEPLYPGECAALTLSFSTTLAKVNHRLGVGQKNVNLSHFYPVLCSLGENGFREYVYSSNGDPFVADCANYTLSLTLPAEYRIAHNGVGSSEVSGNKQTLTVTAEGVREVSLVMGTELSCATAEAGEIPVEYWYTSDPAPESTLKAATDAISYFSRTFGDYGYPRYVLVETDFPYGGMEYSGLAMISSALQRADVAAVVAHETAHQWWYGMVGSNQFENAWQDEGLAEYSAALFLGAFPEYGDTYEGAMKRSESGYRAFFSYKSQIAGEADTTMNRPLTAFTGEYEYRNIAYDKGVILFDRVRATVGERKFFTGLKNYVAAYTGKIASPEELISCFRKVGANVEGLFNSFTDGACVI